jgi:hypothetical protein
MTQDLHAYEQMRAQIMRAVIAEERVRELEEALEDLIGWVEPSHAGQLAARRARRVLEDAES